jgi:homospermidine synthase
MSFGRKVLRNAIKNKIGTLHALKKKAGPGITDPFSRVYHDIRSKGHTAKDVLFTKKEWAAFEGKTGKVKPIAAIYMGRINTAKNVRSWKPKEGTARRRIIKKNKPTEDTQ